MADTRLGFVGLGKMGAAMAARLIEQGFELTVWNRTPERAAPLLALGAQQANSPREVAANCDLLISVLSDDEAALSVYTADDGLLDAPPRGKLFIDMSTLRPETVVLIAGKATELGAAFLDSPVAGTIAPARDGQLIALVGGELKDLERARPVLDVLCRRIIHVGAQGQGALMKLVINLPLGVYWQALTEAIALGHAGGLSMDLMLDTISNSGASLAALPGQIPTILDPSISAKFDVETMRKDLTYVVAAAAAAGIDAPAASAALATYGKAVVAGYAKADAVAIISHSSQLLEQD